MKSDKDNGTYCRLFFTHVALVNGHAASPCCRYDTMPEYKNGGMPATVSANNTIRTFAETFSSPQWEKLRQNSIDGIKEPGCWKCYNEDDSGLTSLRKISNERPFIQYIDPEQKNLYFLEINFGNYCNLACNMCCSFNSDKWYDHDQQLFDMGWSSRRPTVDEKSEFTLNADDYKNVKYIKLVGGEPMLHPKFIPFLEFLISIDKHKDIALKIFTNASWVPKKKILDLLSKFKFLELSISVDGVGEVNSYSRWPSDWNIVDAVCNTWCEFNRDNDNMCVIFEPTISIYNSNNMIEWFEWWLEKMKIINNGEPMQRHNLNEHIFFNVLASPNWLRAGLNPNAAEESMKLREYIFTSKLISAPMIDFKSVLRALAPIDDENLKQKFANYSHDLDSIRKCDIRESLPELWSFFADKYKYEPLKT